jgi:hypothetical protein
MNRTWTAGMADPFFVSVRLADPETPWRSPRRGSRHRAMVLRSSEAKRSSSSSVVV